MCLAVPMRIINIQGSKAQVESGGLEYEVDLSLLPEAALDDYVLVHAGFAIQIMDKKEADETLALFQELNDLQC
ncbi:MAG: HypC/HybG/HupF family hydrogenase formation chaperone [Spirochaetales bacterium]|nr:HypC/HybG/HupF family hydrogenase formation chaperone [Spirochaetales bacterium]